MNSVRLQFLVKKYQSVVTSPREKIHDKAQTALNNFNNYILQFGEKGDKQYTRTLLDQYLEAQKQLEDYQSEPISSQSSSSEEDNSIQSQESSIMISEKESEESIEYSFSESFSSKEFIEDFRIQFKKDRQSEKLNLSPYYKMSPKQKIRYFEEINKNYTKKLRNKKIQKGEKKKKFVTFCDQIFYKTFKNQDEPKVVSHSRQKQEILIRQFWEYSDQ